jgi:aromatic-L-amino-acid decarboxylase
MASTLRVLDLQNLLPAQKTSGTFDVAPVDLEPTPQEMAELVRVAAARVVEHIATLPNQRASDTEGGREAAEAVMEPLPEFGQPLEPLLDLFFRRVLPKGYNTASPGTLSHVTGGGLFHAAVADFIAAATNPYVGYWGAAPGCAQIEHTVVRWFCDIIGLPPSAGGVLTSGGSMANLTALVTARTVRLGDDFSRGTIYTSDQVHHCVRKAALFAGFPAANVRLIATDATCRMKPEALQAAIREDRAAGFKPFLLVATGGTTNTGAVDDLVRMSEIAAEEGLWFHVDAAYGGFFAMTDRGRARLAGIERADSVALDPHKSLFLPFGTGSILVRRVDDLRRAHTIHSDYIHTVLKIGDEAGATNLADLSPEMSRDFRGMRVWLPLKLLGAESFRAYLDEKLTLAEWATSELRSMEGVEIIAEPQLSIMAFRITRPNLEGAECDALNHRIMERVNQIGRVHISGTSVQGKYALRICALAFRAHREAIVACLEDLRTAMKEETILTGSKPR